MVKTNKANIDISNRNGRVDFTNGLVNVTSEFCSMIERIYGLHCEKRFYESDEKRLIADYGQYTAKINDLELSISETLAQISTLIFKVEIMFASHCDFKNEYEYFQEMINDAQSDISKDDFKTRFDSFRSEIAKEVEAYIKECSIGAKIKFSDFSRTKTLFFHDIVIVWKSWRGDILFFC